MSGHRGLVLEIVWLKTTVATEVLVLQIFVFHPLLPWNL